MGQTDQVQASMNTLSAHVVRHNEALHVLILWKMKRKPEKQTSFQQEKNCRELLQEHLAVLIKFSSSETKHSMWRFLFADTLYSVLGIIPLLRFHCTQ